MKVTSVILMPLMRLEDLPNNVEEVAFVDENQTFYLGHYYKDTGKLYTRTLCQVQEEMVLQEDEEILFSILHHLASLQ